MKTRAALFREVGSPLEVREIELREPRPDEVLVRMAAVGICGTDLHVLKGEWERPKPMVLGHEGAGVVEAVGDDVHGIEEGDAVVLSWAPSCGRCADCARGRPAACIELQRAIGSGTLLDGTTGMEADGEVVFRGTATGALAERLTVGAEVALPLGDGIPLEQAALLGCAALTGVGAVLFQGRPEPGSSVLVIGAGDVGQFCVQGARIAGAGEIVCVDPIESRLEQARREQRRPTRSRRRCEKSRRAASTSPSTRSATPRRRRSHSAGPATAAARSSSACPPPVEGSTSTRPTSSAARRS